MVSLDIPPTAYVAVVWSLAEPRDFGDTWLTWIIQPTPSAPWYVRTRFQHGLTIRFSEMVAPDGSMATLKAVIAACDKAADALVNEGFTEYMRTEVAGGPDVLATTPAGYHFFPERER